MILEPNSIAEFLLAALFLCHVGASTYQLDTDYSGSSFFNGFSFFTQPDYTHGFVSYLNQTTASNQGIIGTIANESVYMGVDYTSVLNPATGPGRASVRITSKKAWTHGLFILDLAHMPGTDCGSWPAFWMVGPNWPAGGEIDIIEGVNSNALNQVSLHTNDNCSIAGTGELGTMINPICQESASTGCGVLTSTPSSYGTPFNLASGGIYATEWTSSYIRVWYFPRSAIPTDILTHEPDPKNWGLPQANMMGDCDIDRHFYSHQIAFDTTFCGDWAGSVWPWDSVCSVKAPDCNTYVAENPAAFADAYWMVNYLMVYTSASAAAMSTSQKAAATSSLRATVSGSKFSTSSTLKPASSTSKISSSGTRPTSSVILTSTKKPSSPLSSTMSSTKNTSTSSSTNALKSSSTLKSPTSSLIHSLTSLPSSSTQKSPITASPSLLVRLLTLTSSSSTIFPTPTSDIFLPIFSPKQPPNHGSNIFARSGFANVSSSIVSVVPAKSNAGVLASSVEGSEVVRTSTVVVSTGVMSTSQSASIPTSSKSGGERLKMMQWRGRLWVVIGVVLLGL